MTALPALLLHSSALSHPQGLGPQYLGPKWRRSLPQEAHVPDGLILQLRPEKGIQLSQDSDEPAAGDSTVGVSQDRGGPHLRTPHAASWQVAKPAGGGCVFGSEGPREATHTLASARAWPGPCGFGLRFDLA